MRVLVTGATGFIGRRLCPALVDEGYDVRAMTRRPGEYDGPGMAVLRIGCRPGKLVLCAENPCQRRPTWQTRKPEAIEGFREGGYGLLLVRALARGVRCTWRDGRARVRAEFASAAGDP